MNFSPSTRASLLVVTGILLGLATGYVLRGAQHGETSAEHGLAELAAGHGDSAVALLGEALRENPRDATLHLALAQAYESLGWKNEAQKELQLSAQGSKETLRKAYLSLSAIESKAGNPIEAKRLAGAAQAL